MGGSAEREVGGLLRAVVWFDENAVQLGENVVVEGDASRADVRLQVPPF